MSTAIMERTDSTSALDQYLADYVWLWAKGQPGNVPDADLVLSVGFLPEQFPTHVDTAKRRLKAAADLKRADELEAECIAVKPEVFHADRLTSDFPTLGELDRALNLLRVPGSTRIEDQLAEADRRGEIVRLRSFAQRTLRQTASRHLHNEASSLAEQKQQIEKNILPESDAAEIKQIERELEAAIYHGQRVAAVNARRRLVELQSAERASELEQNRKQNVKARREIAKLQQQITAVEEKMLDPEAMELSE